MAGVVAVAACQTKTTERVGEVAPFVGDVEEIARESTDFRRVLYTPRHLQLVVMSLQVGEEIGAEKHDVDQCLFIVAGEGEAVIDEQISQVSDETVVCVPAGAMHNLRNTGAEPMKLFTVYAPPQHPAGTVHATKQDAEEAGH